MFSCANSLFYISVSLLYILFMIRDTVFQWFIATAVDLGFGNDISTNIKGIKQTLHFYLTDLDRD